MYLHTIRVHARDNIESSRLQGMGHDAIFVYVAVDQMLHQIASRDSGSDLHRVNIGWDNRNKRWHTVSLG